ncbi:TPA: D-hexose-6-phosphate mutarotase [Klebsiella oxytoca]|nr:D-hexose-6-phosphate mutarotase [Klebsiella oxytoca]HED2705120.1 D-hexose-6-phosphate mutarotase [Klebsiella oxytoca]
MSLIKQLFTLPVLETLSPGITRRKMDELEVVVIQTPFCKAAIALQGAHLLTWKPSRQAYPVLWLSDCTPFKIGVPIRGGVPVCWPWFTDLGGEPFHGFARILPWRLTALDNNKTSFALTLKLNDTPQTRQLWDHTFQLEMTLTFTAEVCELLLTAHGSFSATAALHSYLSTPDIRATQIYGVGMQGYDTVAGEPVQNLPSPLSLSGEFGTIFPQAKKQTALVTPARTLTLTHVNNSNVVVWNPWQQRAEQISDMSDDGWQNFVCLETAAIDSPLVSTPQHPASIGVQFALSHH